MHSQRKGQRAETELAGKLQSLGFFAERSSAMYETGKDCRTLSEYLEYILNVKRLNALT